MTDLPTPPTRTDVDALQNSTVSQFSEGSGAKEKETGLIAPELPLEPAGKEMELPKEVVSAGVRVRPTTVPLPANVLRLGVRPIGANVPPPGPGTVALPLTDDQIALGLHEGITSSWRWLAEWCVLQLKRLHFGFQRAHGKLTRTKA